MAQIRHGPILVLLLFVLAAATAQAQLPTTSTPAPTATPDDGPTCPPTAGLPADPTTAFLLRLQVENRGGPDTSRVCSFGRSGAVLFNENVTAPRGVARSWDLYLHEVPDRVVVEHPTAPNGQADGLASRFLACSNGGAAFDYAYADRILVLSARQGCLERNHVIGAFEDAPLVNQEARWRLVFVGVGVGGAGVALVFLARARRLRLDLLALFSRILGARLLDHPARSQIRLAVEADPGVRAHELVGRLEIPATTLAFHLGALRRARVLTTIGPPLAPRYFVAGQMSHAEMLRRAALRNPRLDAFRRLVAETPGVTLSVAAGMAGLSRAHASKFARRLEALGLVRRALHGRNLQLFPLFPSPPR